MLVSLEPHASTHESGNGDVLVRRETRDGTVVYILRTAPGTDQYLLRTREDAVVQAVTFAERQGVRAWLIQRSPRAARSRPNGGIRRYQT